MQCNPGPGWVSSVTTLSTFSSPISFFSFVLVLLASPKIAFGYWAPPPRQGKHRGGEKLRVFMASRPTRSWSATDRYLQQGERSGSLQRRISDGRQKKTEHKLAQQKSTAEWWPHPDHECLHCASYLTPRCVPCSRLATRKRQLDTWDNQKWLDTWPPRRSGHWLRHNMRALRHVLFHHGRMLCRCRQKISLAAAALLPHSTSTLSAPSDSALSSSSEIRMGVRGRGGARTRCFRTSANRGKPCAAPVNSHICRIT